jgi:hypothetical protein
VHTTVFKARPGEVEQPAQTRTFHKVLRSVTPPILVDAFKSFRK